ncbi:MAG: hypothetical protein IKJ84_02535 [Oscillospiraceae bacterium]|nr:hypothetical protein [Oscillospiraceae bacterium]
MADKFRNRRRQERLDAFLHEEAAMGWTEFRRYTAMQYKGCHKKEHVEACYHRPHPKYRPLPTIIPMKYQNRVTNYMGSGSYELSPLETLKMVSASSILGEPQYYRDGNNGEPYLMRDGVFRVDPLFRAYALLDWQLQGKTTSQVMETLIDRALDQNFGGVLDWAVVLRREYLMRLNPQVIMVRAAMHPKRAAFTEAHPGVFAKTNDIVMSRADEPASQLAYYLDKQGSKASIPNILKRSWAQRIGRMTPYELFKYRNRGLGLVDTIRISHAKGTYVDELMRTGTVSVEENSRTWESMRSAGMSWREILTSTKVGHMALLRNLRGIFTEIDDPEFCEKMLQQLKKGVPGGKQFPFRYQSAMNAVNDPAVHHRPQIMAALEECMDIACANMPRLSGKTMCLSDNSGSAWGCFNSEYGIVTVANIDNLSSVITARNSDEGYVGVFGDRLTEIPVEKCNSILSQARKADWQGRTMGMATENGVWLFFDKAIRCHEHWDNIFIYSDMQAGHGGLYGLDCTQYRDYCCRGNCIDVALLIDTYRRQVNPKVNIYCIQTAGYNNVLIPENGYRTTVLYGWTGKELVYADAMNRFWDDVDEAHTKLL